LHIIQHTKALYILVTARRSVLKKNLTAPTLSETRCYNNYRLHHYNLCLLLLIKPGDCCADPNLATTPSTESGAFMRDVRNRGETALHRAAAFASEETIQLLIDAGAKTDAKDMNGDSPLTWASWHLQPDSVLRKLLYDGFSIRPARRSMDSYLLGTPDYEELTKSALRSNSRIGGESE
jgi:Ankyrin repeats (3 copies)